ncbi:MAG: hypothetical protein JW741_01210 [Sedimentisphaerales bacterium]|nr:hypothetical protein [Sedimentisphaerales bacterium]
MTRLLLGVALLAVLPPALARAQKEAPGEDFERQMDVREMQLELEARERRADYESQMAQLELEARRAEINAAHGEREGGPLALLLIGCLVVRVLVAVWIYQDIRLRNAGSGLWIVLGLLGGLLAALVYAVVRLGDADNGKKRMTAQA